MSTIHDCVSHITMDSLYLEVRCGRRCSRSRWLTRVVRRDLQDKRLDAESADGSQERESAFRAILGFEGTHVQRHSLRASARAHAPITFQGLATRRWAS